MVVKTKTFCWFTVKENLPNNDISSLSLVIPDRYYITNTYDGGILIIDCDLGDIGDLHACPITSRLTDNITGEGQQFKDNEFVGWNNSFRIVIQTTSPGIISQVNIYFYNNPSIGYGLAPLITAGYGFDSPLMASIPLQTSFLENSDLSQNNDIVTNVSLILTNEDDLPYEYLELSFDLSSAKINQVFLSEIQVFNGTGLLCLLYFIVCILVVHSINEESTCNSQNSNIYTQFNTKTPSKYVSGAEKTRS